MISETVFASYKEAVERLEKEKQKKTMSQRVTIGGERLGAGKKMKAEMHEYERSTHDLSYAWRSTMSAGTLVPFLKK